MKFPAIGYSAIFLILCSVHVLAQKPPKSNKSSKANKPPLIYQFNNNFELISGAPSIFKKEDLINVNIPFDMELFHSQLNVIRRNNYKARLYWKSIKQKYNLRQDSSWTLMVEKLDNELDDFYETLDNTTDDELLDPSSSWNIVNARSCEYEYVPCPRDVISRLKKQILIKAYGSDCACEQKLDDTLIKDDICGWHYVLNKDFNPGGDLRFDLYQQDPIKALSIWWYNAQYGYFPYDEFSLFEKSRQNNKMLFDSLNTYLSKSKHFVGNSTEACLERKNIVDFANTLDSVGLRKSCKDVTDQIDYLRTWILGFAWMNPDSKPRLNPFSFTNSSLYRNLDDNKSKDDTVDIHIKKSMDSLLKSQSIKLADYKDVMAALYKHDSLALKMDSISNDKSKQIKKNADQNSFDNDNQLSAFQTTLHLINKINTPATLDRDTLLGIRNYYFNRRPDKRHFEYDYPENESVVLAIYNKPTAAGLTLTDQSVVYNEQTPINETTKATIPNSSLASSAASLTTQLNAGAQEIETMSLNDVVVTGYTTRRKRTIVPNSPPLSCAQIYDSVLSDLQDRYGKFIILDSIYNLSQIPPYALQTTSNDSARLLTDVIYPDRSMKVPYQYSYKLAIKDTSKNLAVINPIDSSGYRVGKRRFVELGLGVAYAFTSVEQVNIDTAGGVFNPSSSENKIQFMVGLKFHLWRSIYWGNNQFVFSKKSLHDGTLRERLFAFVGVSIPNPLNNIYTGIGVDLVPGLSLHAGAQWYEYKKYSVNNNIILKETTVYRPAFYMGVTADPILVVNIIKTFFN